ncbi:MAG: sodium:calcium antiporter [Alphaproteobacteria bacterium]|nr:sodium:calcium antiporter [Alphaproteobacteria bacterium]
MPDFQSFNPLVNAAIFLVSAGLVWVAGARLVKALDRFATITGIGHAFIGMLALGAITSLPEVATVGTSSWIGNAPLAVNNVLGSTAANVVLLSFGDLVAGRRALTSIVTSVATLMQGTLDIILLGLLAIILATGDVAIGGVGVGTLGLGAVYVFMVWVIVRYRDRRSWVPARSPDVADLSGQPVNEGREVLPSLLAWSAGAAAVILVAGTLLSQSGEAIAVQTGLGASLVGMVLVGFATSMPEASSVLNAVRAGRPEMAMGDILGTNIFNIALLLLGDALYAGPPILSQAGRFETVATLLAIVLTAIYVFGLIERSDRSLLRLGYDSWAVLVVYVGGVTTLYFLRGV